MLWLALTSCAWIGSERFQADVGSLSFLLEELEGEFGDCSSTGIAASGSVDPILAGERLTLTVAFEGQATSAEADVGDDGRITWAFGQALGPVGDVALEPTLRTLEVTVAGNAWTAGSQWSATFAPAPAFYVDADGDGVGAAAVPGCERPAGTVELGGDCDDDAPEVAPGAPERCNGIDDDCDGATDDEDDDLVDGTFYYRDADGDDYGDADETVSACAMPPGYVADAGDCDDQEATVNPEASEICDGIDNDCAGGPDDGLPLVSAYPDGDGDGFGAAGSAPSQQCSASLPGYAASADDCDDGEPAIHPGAPERCDDIDWNCTDGPSDASGVFVAGEVTTLHSVQAALAGPTGDIELAVCGDQEWSVTPVDQILVDSRHIVIRGYGDDATLNGSIAFEDGGAIPGSLEIANLDLVTGSGVGPTGDATGGALTLIDVHGSLVDVEIAETQSDRPDRGGGLFAQGGELELVDVRIRDTRAELGGGAYFEGVDLTITGSLQIDRGTADQGGGIWARGVPLLENLLLQDNQADFGAGLYLDAVAAPGVEVSGTFLRNLAGTDGGGIRATGSGPLTVSGAMFDSNTAEEGGAISLGPSVSPSVVDVAFTSNAATLRGGAVALRAAGSVQGSAFTGNGAQDPLALGQLDGGAIWADLSASTTPLELDQVEFSDNAASRGGALFALSTGSLAEILVTGTGQTGFDSNTAAAGGAMYLASVDLDVDGADARFADNQAVVPSSPAPLAGCGGAVFLGAEGAGPCGAFTGGAPAVFQDNWAVTDGGAIYATDAGASVGCSANRSGATSFLGNGSPVGGGAGSLAFDNTVAPGPEVVLAIARFEGTQADWGSRFAAVGFRCPACTFFGEPEPTIVMEEGAVEVQYRAPTPDVEFTGDVTCIPGHTPSCSPPTLLVPMP